MNERLKQFIEYLQLSTRAFEQKISVSNGLIARFVSKNTSIQSDVLSKICDTFPELNFDWLVTGKGEMLRGSDWEKPSDTTVSILLQRIEDLARENGSLQAQIDEYKKEIALLQRSASPPAAKTASA